MKEIKRKKPTQSLESVGFYMVRHRGIEPPTL
jgi:hypothetical protein